MFDFWVEFQFQMIVLNEPICASLSENGYQLFGELVRQINLAVIAGLCSKLAMLEACSCILKIL